MAMPGAVALKASMRQDQCVLDPLIYRALNGERNKTAKRNRLMDMGTGEEGEMYGKE